MTTSDIDRLLHDADRLVMGANMARRMGDAQHSASMHLEASALYRQAMTADPQMTDPAWRETGNRDTVWLRSFGFDQIAAIVGGPEP